MPKGARRPRAAHRARSGARRTRATKGQAKVHKVMSEYKHGTLHSGSKHGPLVHSRAQAVAIALSEKRRAQRGHA